MLGIHPKPIHRAKAYAGELKAQEQAERARIDSNKAAALAKRIQKEEERAVRALQTSIRRQGAKAAKQAGEARKA